MTTSEASRPAVEPPKLKCPVCGAAFRGVEICPRCGTNLQPLLRITARAWALRNESRAKLRAGDLAAALHCSSLAREIQRRGVSVSNVERILASKSRMPQTPASIPELRREPQMVSTESLTTSNRPVASGADGTGQPPAAGGSGAARPLGTSWPLALALTLPALFWIAYLLVTRRTPGNHNAALNWVTLLITLAAGTALYWRGSRGRRATVGALLLYVFSQALWLIVVAITTAA